MASWFFLKKVKPKVVRFAKISHGIPSVRVVANKNSVLVGVPRYGLKLKQFMVVAVIAVMNKEIDAPLLEVFGKRCFCIFNDDHKVLRSRLIQ